MDAEAAEAAEAKVILLKLAIVLPENSEHWRCVHVSSFYSFVLRKMNFTKWSCNKSFMSAPPVIVQLNRREDIGCRPFSELSNLFEILHKMKCY